MHTRTIQSYTIIKNEKHFEVNWIKDENEKLFEVKFDKGYHKSLTCHISCSIFYVLSIDACISLFLRAFLERVID